MTDLSVKLGPIHLRNPIVTASGTFGYGREYADLVPLDQLGAITVKGISTFPWHGNPQPRTVEVFGGMLNAIGLENPGVEKFLTHPDYLPFLRSYDVPVFVNIWGRSIEDYQSVASCLDQDSQGISALEINISCPNIKEGGISFGTDTKLADEVISAVREVTSLPLITKLSPNVSNITHFAKCAQDAGSDIISLINTLPGMKIDIDAKQPVLANRTGGLSGPAIKPIAVRMVYEASSAVDIPVIGMGGIYTWEDAIEFLLAGASAIGIGTATFSNPDNLLQIITGINSYLEENDFDCVGDIVGLARQTRCPNA
jgi:dihydroorotate dehydrogenase (NAD+) catalytic subunit